MTALVVEGLTVEYGSGDRSVRALDDMSFDVDWGQIALLLGPSGSGKTTLLSVLGGLLRPQSGGVTVDGVDVTAMEGRALESYRRGSVGFVFQSFNLIASLSARENIAVPLILAGTSRTDALERADHLARRLGLDGHASRRPDQLSGGQQQRVAIARGLVNDPAVLLADEPTANLDQEQTGRIVDVLGDLRSDGLAMIISSHDPRMLPIADQIVTVAGGGHAPNPQRVRYEPGEVIFERGTWGELIYVVEEGEVELGSVDASREVPLRTLEVGQHFGELGPILGIARHVTATARTAVTLSAYGVGEFRKLKNANGPALPPARADSPIG